MTSTSLARLSLLWCLVCLFQTVRTEDAYNYNNNNNNQYDGNYQGGQGADNYQDNNYNGGVYQQGDDYITYWTEYAVLPKRCIVYNDQDVIVFSMHEHGYQKQCTDDPTGTYIAPVPYFLDGYLKDIAQEMEDQGYEYQAPDVAQYIECTPFVIENVQYYFQVGCADGTSQALAVNIYEDNACTTRSVVDGFDDSNIDVSSIQLPFKKCLACVNWYDMDGDVDDQYYEQHQTTAPLCSTAWAVKETCGRKCKHTGVDSGDGHGWNTSDKILLSILSVFGLTMLGLILRKRQRMSNKDALLEQAAMSAAGLQQPHVIGILVLVVLVVAVFALLGLKNITWALLLLVNTALFGYLMKLTVDSGVSTGTVVGPDGEIVRQCSDDSSCDDSHDESTKRNAGTYSLPTIT